MRRNLNQIVVKENLVEDLIEEEGIILGKNLTGEIILGKNLTAEVEIIPEKDHTGEEGIIMEKDLTAEVEIIPEESQPTKKAVDEVSITILLINLKIRALGTVIENHHLKDSAV